MSTKYIFTIFTYDEVKKAGIISKQLHKTVKSKLKELYISIIRLSTYYE